jgi:hypothetical protein
MMKLARCVNMGRMSNTPDPQSAPAVLMVRPASFGFNPQTADSNAFQRHGVVGDALNEAVLAEFDAAVAALRQCGIEVLVASDSASPIKPDAIFPNNWVSFHYDGTVALYPMLAENRRSERRDEILEQLVEQGGYRITRTVDLTHREAQGKYLEGTGSLVLDRMHHIAYACLSPRTDLDVLGEFAQLLDFELVTFEAADVTGQSVYHTNVVMAIGSRFAVVCGEAIANPAHRHAVFSKLADGGHEIVDIAQGQMQRFAGNMLELATPQGPLLALSRTALASLEAAQLEVLERHARLLTVDIPTVEHVGGGGIRCMLAEIHLPKRRMS